MSDSYAKDETAQKIAAAMRREGLNARAEMDTMIAAGYRAPSLLVGMAMKAAQANIKLVLLAIALVEHTGLKTKAAEELAEEIPEIKPILSELFE